MEIHCGLQESCCLREASLGFIMDGVKEGNRHCRRKEVIVAKLAPLLAHTLTLTPLAMTQADSEGGAGQELRRH